ncbi:MAG: hypothetical protein ABEJ31_15050 [Haloarculaceae archaeon]
MSGEPIEGEVLLLAGVKASVGPQRVPDLVDLVQADLAPRLEEYDRAYETAYDREDHAAFFVEDGHWAEIGDRLDFEERELDAVRRAHHAQLNRQGRRADRLEAFESALEIRDCVLIGREEELLRPEEL